MVLKFNKNEKKIKPVIGTCIMFEVFFEIDHHQIIVKNIQNVKVPSNKIIYNFLQFAY